jgi:small subunit ribosomal protein S7
MPRRNRPVRRKINSDPRYNSVTLQEFINKLMMNGKKGTAERIVYGALAHIEARTRQDPMDVFQSAIRNVTPQMEVKPRRVGGATYQVPVEIRADRRSALAVRWLLTAARKRGGRAMAERLAQEILDASTNQGTAVKRREETHRMAEANRAFVHYRW